MMQIHIDRMVIAMVDMEEEKFEKIFNSLIFRYGFERTITEIIYPFLEKIGILWQTHNITPAHEHFISNLIRQKLIVAIDGLVLPPITEKKILLFLPEDELHEIGLLFYHYLSRKAGYRSYYLGQCVPHPDLVSIVAKHSPDILVACITSSPTMPIQDYLKLLKKDFPNCLILISGHECRNLKAPKTGNIRIFSTATEFKQLL